MYDQLVAPNLDPYVYQGNTLLTDWYGWCLVTVQTAFNAPWAGSTAWDAWSNHVAYQHYDRSFPVNVYFPIWFSGYGGAGHVAIAYVNPDGSMSIWTSPYLHVPNFYTGYVSIDALAKGYGITYVGWSEDIGGERVIQPQQPTNTQQGGDTVAIIDDGDNWRNRANASFMDIRGRVMKAGEFEPWIGQDFLHLIEALEDDAEAAQNQSNAALGAQARAENWQGQLTAAQESAVDLQKKLTSVTDDDTLTKQQLKDALAEATELTQKLSIAMTPPVPTSPAPSKAVSPSFDWSKLWTTITKFLSTFKK